VAALARLPPTSPLALAIAAGAQLWEADAFNIVLRDGVTTFNCTSWPVDLTLDGVVYASRKPWLETKSWNISNTMEVPEAVVLLHADASPFNGGANIKAQMHNGLFDGASIVYSAVYFDAAGVAAATPLQVLPILGGVVADIDLGGVTATINVRGKTDLLDQMAPRNLYQIGCNHAFCDAGCTLSIAAFTASYLAGASGLTRAFIPWPGAPPANAALYTNGTLTFTSGAASGQTRTIGEANASGLTLNYPLYLPPAAGDAFTAVQGCDWSFDSGSGQSCTYYGNTQHWRGFDQVPPPNAAY
jgi:uncharacterized phage protein (TIGR02218 family)